MKWERPWFHPKTHATTVAPERGGREKARGADHRKNNKLTSWKENRKKGISPDRGGPKFHSEVKLRKKRANHDNSLLGCED